MSDWVIIATGQSLAIEDVEYIKGRAKCVAVSNAWKLAPWADALFSYDPAWWLANPDALEFQGPRLCGKFCVGTARFRIPGMPQGCNSGLAAMFFAREQGATRILLLGFDMHGTHYFGPHPKGLKNTPPHYFKVHLRQFTSFAGVEVINCTQGSALERYPFKPLREALC